MGRFLGIIVKRVVPCRCYDGHVQEPYEMHIHLGLYSVILFILNDVKNGEFIRIDLQLLNNLELIYQEETHTIT